MTDFLLMPIRKPSNEGFFITFFCSLYGIFGLYGSISGRLSGGESWTIFISADATGPSPGVLWPFSILLTIT
jgi:hypothetical protein